MDLNRRRRARPRDAGFTLVEAMIAGTLGSLLLLPAYALLRNAYSTASVVNSRFQRNAEARQILTLIGEGASGSYGGTFVRGLRSQGSLPASWVASTNGQLTITDNSTHASVSGDQTPSITIPCTGPATPVPACLLAGVSVTMAGWLGAAPAVVAPIIGRTATVGITVVDPFQGARANQTQGSAVDTYRSQFNLNAQ